jgi:HEAT repeat protein
MVTTTDEAIAKLRNEKLPTNERKSAARFLQNHPTEEGTEALVEALQDRNPGVRWACGSALAAQGDFALKPLLRALTSTENDPMLREGAHHALAHNSSAQVRTETQELREALIGPGAQLASMEAAAKLLYKS